MTKAHKAIFRQRIYRNVYSLQKDTYWETVSVGKGNEFLEDSIFFTCRIDHPPLKKGEYFYIEELEQLVQIKSVTRTSNNSILYYIEPKYIDDAISLQSNEKANREVFLEYRELRNKYNDVLGELDKIKNSFWYKFMRKR